MSKYRPKFLFAALLIIAINFSVFYPSLEHKPRADQLEYLIEVALLDSPVQIIDHSLSYTRSRFFLTGDHLYYRPLLYLALAMKYHLFHYSFSSWQLTGIIIHIALAIFLLNLLNQIAPHRWLGLLFALFFSVIYLISEMVIWHHINMYMVSFLLILLALSHIIRILRGQTANALLPLLYLIISSLINEFAVFASLIFGVTLALLRRGKAEIKISPLSFAIPIVAYVGFNFFDYIHHYPPTQLIGHLSSFSSNASVLVFIRNFLIVIAMSLCGPFIPALFSMNPQERSYMFFFYEWPGDDAFNNIALIGASPILWALALIFLYLLLKYRHDIFQGLNARLSPSEGTAVRFTLYSCIGLAIAYAMLYTAVRSHFQYGFINYMRFSTYHFYPIILFTTVAGYIMCIAIDRSAIPVRRLMMGLAAAILIVSATLNAYQTLRFNALAQKKYSPWSAFIGHVDQFIEAHQHEPNFSIKFAQGEKSPLHLRKIDDNSPEINPYPSESLFRRHIDSENPKYIIYNNFKIQKVR